VQALEAAIEAVQPLATAKSIVFATELDPAAGMIYADTDRLQQVFWNLLASTVKFTPRGGRVVVELKRPLHDGPAAWG
jgi:signal transduction histidine kinase